MSENGWLRDASIPEEKHQKFVELTESPDSPFHDWELNELFVYAAAFGFDQGLRKELENQEHALFQWNQLDDSQMWIVKSIAVKEEETAEVLENGRQIGLIAREYANGGIDRLFEMYVGTVDLFTRLTDDVLNLAEV